MIDDTINDGKTVAGGGKDVVLAGRYRIIRKFAARNTRFVAHVPWLTCTKSPNTV